MSKFKLSLLENLFCLVLGLLMFGFFATETYAEEIIIDCDGEVYKYKKSFWSDPVVSVRSSAQWKPYCEEGSLQIHDKGAECNLNFEYETDIYNKLIHNSKTVTKAKNIMKEDWVSEQKTASEKTGGIGISLTIRTIRGYQEIDKLSLEQYIKKYAPTIGQSYRVKTETLTITTEQTYLIDFYLKKISRTIEDGSNGNWFKKCELLPR